MAPARNNLSISYLAVKSLVPYAKNARTHSAAQVAQIAKSIEKFGFTNPILADGKNGVIAGHGRLLAAAKLGMAKVPVVALAGLSDADKRALVLADNKLALNAGWDEDMLRLELSDLTALGADLDLTGFSAAELSDLMGGGGGNTDPDEVPATPTAPVVRLGELWHLGAHRLLIGDSTVSETVRRLMGGSRAQMIFTDPPYGVDYTGGMKKRERLAGDHIGTDIYAAALKNLAAAADDRAALYLWYADGHVSAAAAAAAAAAAGYQIVAQIIWAKNHAQFMTSAHYKGKHEPCFYARRSGKSARWHGPNNEVTLWECARSPRNDFHPTQKPVELAQRAIKNSSQHDDIVLDLFTGGGTTLIASEMEGRRAYCMELNPAYGQVIIERWQAFTGKTATREDGATLEDLKDGKTSRRALRRLAAGKDKVVSGKKLAKALAKVK